MSNLTKVVTDELVRRGADLVGAGDLTMLTEDVRCGLPTGISIAVKYPREVIRGIAELPTLEYQNWYNTLNERLNSLVIFGEELLKSMGYSAVAQTRKYIGNTEGKLPHKTVATRAGLGWIGKCALLITEQYGSMVRLSSVLTNAPLTHSRPVNQSKCGGCRVCTDACPGGAVTGKEWNVEMNREDFYHAVLCRDTALERSKLGFGKAATLCGKCIVVCPYTQRYLRNEAAVE